MQRRTVMRNMSVVSIGFVTGCLSRVGRSNGKEPSGGNVLVRNEDNDAHKIRINIANDSETVFESEMQLDPSSRENFPEAFGEGEYDVQAELNGKNTVEHHLTVGNCSAITLHVTITTSGKIEIEQDYCD